MVTGQVHVYIEMEIPTNYEESPKMNTTDIDCNAPTSSQPITNIFTCIVHLRIQFSLSDLEYGGSGGGWLRWRQWSLANIGQLQFISH